MTRYPVGIFGLVVSASLMGCQNKQSMSSPIVLDHPRSMDYVNASPIQVDPAMQQRNWSRTPAFYPNLSSTTGSAQYQLVPDHNLNGNVRAAIEPPLFVVNTLLLPAWMIGTPPWSQVESTSLYLPPSATGNPPLTPADRSDFSGGPLGSAYTTASGRAAQPTIH